jgi:putative oxidoreductase
MDALLYAPPPGAARAAAWAATSVRWLLAAAFLAMAARNLAGDERMATDFRRWGYPDSFRAFTAALQVVGASLLLVPATSFLGLAALGAVLLGAVGTHLMHDPAPSAIPAAAFLAVVAALGAYYRPPLLRG